MSQFPADRFGKESLVMNLIELFVVRRHEVFEHLFLEHLAQNYSSRADRE
jgi:hypothetical protein